MNTRTPILRKWQPNTAIYIRKSKQIFTNESVEFNKICCPTQATSFSNFGLFDHMRNCSWMTCENMRISHGKNLNMYLESPIPKCLPTNDILGKPNHYVL